MKVKQFSMKKVLFLLGELSDDDIDWIIASSKREDVEPGTILIYEGQPIDTLYILLDGKLVVTTAATSKEIAILSGGEVVGEMSFVDSRPPSATVKALEKSLVLSIPRSDLVTKLYQDIGFSARFYRALALFLSHRLRVTVSQLGYGSPPPTDDPADSTLAPETMDSFALAQTRLDWLLRRLRENGN